MSERASAPTAAHLEDYEERAAILEFEAGLSRPEAERRAAEMCIPRPREQGELFSNPRTHHTHIMHTTSESETVMPIDTARAHVEAQHVETERALRNLLAILHSDGGHHTQEVGITQSVQDAHQVWARLLTQRDTAHQEIARLRVAITVSAQSVHPASRCRRV